MTKEVKRTMWDAEMSARAAGLKRAGIPNAEIAKRLGVPLTAVRSRLHRVGARRRLDGSKRKAMNPPRGRLALEAGTTLMDTVEFMELNHED